MSHRQKRFLLIILAAILLFSLSSIAIYWGSDLIVEFIGLENTYLITFLITTIGGLSIVTSAVSFTSMAVFASGGSNPVLIALCGAVGIFLSDSLYFFLAYYGKKAAPMSWEETLLKIEKQIKKSPNYLTLIFSYLYLGLTPFPNDFLMFALALGGFRYKQIIVPLLAGNITVAVLVTYFGYFFLARTQLIFG